jgi:hypothetical protein
MMTNDRMYIRNKSVSGEDPYIIVMLPYSHSMWRCCSSGACMPGMRLLFNTGTINAACLVRVAVKVLQRYNQHAASPDHALDFYILLLLLHQAPTRT